MKTNKQNNPELNKIQELIASIKVGMFITQSSQGAMYGRPMQTQEMDEEGCLWFFSRSQTDKDQEVAQQSSVNIGYADSNNSNFVSVSGKASIVKDKERMQELWSPIMKAWYPNGLETPGISLIKVKIESAAYWDTSASTMVEIFKIAKAIATGKEYQDGEHGKVQG